MAIVRHILSVSRWLSLDVVVGGVVLCEALSHVAKVDLPWSISAALGCAIWLIYTLDHLIDGNKQEAKPSMPRHVFHQKYRNSIFVTFVIVAGLGLKLLFYLPNIVIIHGCILAGMVGLYFLSIWLFKIYFAKELFIALLYSCGIFLAIFSLGNQLGIVLLLFFIQLIMMAFINLLLFSYYEVVQDQQDGHRSWTTHFGKTRTILHLKILFSMMTATILVSGYFTVTFEEQILQIIFILMTGILGLICLKPEKFDKEEQFRWAGDMVFILPVLIFLF